MAILKVSGKTEVAKLGGAIAHCVFEEGSVEVRALGAASVNQAVKAIAAARGFVAANGIDLICMPSFMRDVLENGERTMVRIVVEAK